MMNKNMNKELDNKVWCETIHKYVTPAAKSMIEGGCCDPDEIRSEFRENVYTDVFGYDEDTSSVNPETGKHFPGVAYIIITDGDEMEVINPIGENRWDVSEIFHSVDEDGVPFDWFAVRANEDDEDDEDEFEDEELEDDPENIGVSQNFDTFPIEITYWECGLCDEDHNDLDGWFSLETPTRYFVWNKECEDSKIIHELEDLGFSGFALRVLMNCIHEFMNQKDENEKFDIQSIFRETWNFCQGQTKEERNTPPMSTFDFFGLTGRE